MLAEPEPECHSYHIAEIHALEERPQMSCQFLVLSLPEGNGFQGGEVYYPADPKPSLYVKFPGFPH